MAGVEHDELLIYAVRSYPCIYDVRNGEFKVALVKDNAWKAYCGHFAENHVRLALRVLFRLRRWYSRSSSKIASSFRWIRGPI